MMPASLDDLITVPSSSELLDQSIAVARLAGMPVASWQSGSVARTLFESNAELNAELYGLISDIARGAHLSTAAGPWLDLLATSHFGISRTDGTATIGFVELTNTDAAPRSFLAAELVFATADGTRRFTNRLPVSLLGLQTLALEVIATQTGAAWNVPNNAITLIASGQPALTVDNPPIGSTWIASPGTDTETDERLRTRCSLQWALRGNQTADQIKAWCFEAAPEVARVRVDAIGAGQLRVVLATETGGASAATVSAVDAVLQVKHALGTSILTMAAAQVFFTFTATVYRAAGDATPLAALQAEAEAAVVRVVNAAPIGGTVYGAALMEALMSPPSAANAIIAGGVSDYIAPLPTNIVGLLLTINAVSL
jgi:uncharacterized phage protein gp47/JayE